MCGIAGFVTAGEDPPDAEGLLRRMTAALTHRGPDDEGFHVEPGVHLGHRRLSIIDLDGGRQPQYSADGKVCVAFNGEIYNHVELRQELEAAGHTFRTSSDTEAIVHGYDEWGEDVLDRLNGMFAIAIWDGRNRTLLLARDRMGQKPLYYAHSAKGLVFGSELKALRDHPWVGSDLDPLSLRKYLLFDYVPSPHTILRGVNKVEAGQAVVWSADSFKDRRYWDLRFAEPPAGSEEELAEQLWALLREAVRIRLRADVPLGIFLSGGIDSSLVLALVAEHLSGDQIHTFNVGFSDSSFDESGFAREVASHFGTRHEERILEPQTLIDLLPGILEKTLDEPMADSSLIPMYLLSAFTRESVKVALGGDGADELFLGYPTFQAHKLAKRYVQIPGWLRRGCVEPIVRRLPVSTRNISLDYRLKRFVSGARYPDVARHFVWIGALDPAAQKELLTDDFLAQAPDGIFADVDVHRHRVDARDEFDALTYVYSKLYMGDDILVKVDRASMAHGLEARAPFLDPRVVSFAASLPTRMKLRGFEMKYVLKKLLRGRVPERIVRRPKKGFGVPIAEWLKGPLETWARDLLAPDNLRHDGIFRPEVVTALLDEHLAGRADHRKALWSLLVFQMWRGRV